MNIGAPQIVWIVIAGLSLGIDLSRHGKPKDGNHSFWVTLIGTAIAFSILYWGGFFTK